MFNSSQLRLISVGYVAENKLRSLDEVEISLTELQPFVNGELVSGIQEESVDCVDSDGQALTFKVKTSNTIRATWFGDGTNRMTSPDVRRAEMVNIYQFGNTDKYYWKSVNMPGVNTRKLETVVTAYSNTTDETQTKLSADNAWHEEVNTHEGHWTRQTNKSNGEKFAYTQQINAKDGVATQIADDAGAYQELDSNEDKHTIEAAGGAKIEVVKDEVIITCRKLTVIATDEIDSTTKNAIIKHDVTTHTGSQFKGNIDNTTFTGDSFVLNTPTVTFNTSNYKIASSKVSIIGGSLTHNSVNVGSTHFHIGNLGRPVSPPR